MSFAAFFKKIEHGLGVAGKGALTIAPIAIPLISAFAPGLQPLMVNLYNDAITAESTFTAAKSGEQKATFVLGQFQNGLSIYQAATGKPIDTNGAMMSAQTLLTSLVTAMNSIVALKSAVDPTVKSGTLSGGALNASSLPV